MRTLFKTFFVLLLTCSLLNGMGQGKGKFGEKGEKPFFEQSGKMMEDVTSFLKNYKEDNNTNEELLALVSESLSSFDTIELNTTMEDKLLSVYEYHRFGEDIYSNAYSQWNLGLFNVVGGIKAFNGDILKLLLDKYSIEYNEEYVNGEYNTEALGEIYNEYLLEIDSSIDNALEISILIEEKIKEQIDSIDINMGDDLKYILSIVDILSKKDMNSFNIALGNSLDMQDNKGYKMDNGSKVKLKETQLASTKVKKGWNLVSIPVTTDTDISEILPDDFQNGIIWTYDNNGTWDYVEIELDSNGSVNQSGYLQISPFQGFWIYSEEEFEIETYIATEVKTSQKIISQPTVPAIY